MDLSLTVHEPACRGCELCVDVCPTRALRMEGEPRVCRVACVEDCIACLSCTYLCPSGAIAHAGYHAVKNFYRDLEGCRKLGRFL